MFVVAIAVGFSFLGKKKVSWFPYAFNIIVWVLYAFVFPKRGYYHRGCLDICIYVLSLYFLLVSCGSTFLYSTVTVMSVRLRKEGDGHGI